MDHHNGQHAAGDPVREPLLTVKQVCDWLTINENHLRKMVERRQIPYKKAGKLLRFSRLEIERWLDDVDRQRRAKLSQSPLTPAVPPARPRPTTATRREGRPGPRELFGR